MILRKLELDKVRLNRLLASCNSEYTKWLTYTDYNVGLNIAIIVLSVSWSLQMMSADKHTSDSDSAANGDVTREICENGMDPIDLLLC